MVTPLVRVRDTEDKTPSRRISSFVAMGGQAFRRRSRTCRRNTHGDPHLMRRIGPSVRLPVRSINERQTSGKSINLDSPAGQEENPNAVSRVSVQ